MAGVPEGQFIVRASDHHDAYRNRGGELFLVSTGLALIETFLLQAIFDTLCMASR